MSDTIRKLKITDDIIDTESEVMFGVLSGAQNITSQRFKSISATPNAMVFKISCYLLLKPSWLEI